VTEPTWGTAVKIGHIFLGQSSVSTTRHFIALVEALAHHGLQQHAFVSSALLARRLAHCRNVTVGPVMKAPVTAYCLMRRLDIAHVHDDKSGQAGLLLTLTRSVPYVLTTRGDDRPGKNPVTRSIYRRAASLICRSDDEMQIALANAPAARIDVVPDIEKALTGEPNITSNYAAAEHLRIYRRAVDARQLPEMVL